jgi:hypothetical protein
MTKFLIITGTRDSGKTTTAGMVYKKLLPCAKNVCLTDGDGKVLTIDDPLLEDGKPKDFIAYLEVNRKKVTIVSIGDYPDYLEQQIKIYLDKVNYFVCCLRTRDREGSTRRMLITNYSNYPKEEFNVWGSGKQGRAFIHVNDIVDALILALEKGWGHGWIQIGPSECTSIREIAEAVVKISGKDITPFYDTTKPEGDKARSADWTKAKEVLGWEPKVKLEDGLREQYEWVKQQIEKNA